MPVSKKASDKNPGVQPQDELKDLLQKQESKVADPASPPPAVRYEEIPLNRIKLSPTNPRTTYDEKDTQELAESIKVEGVIQPVLLRPYGKPGWYQLIFGNRRYKASILAGKETIPALIREMSDEEALNMQIIENLQRKDVKPIEEAVSYKMLMDMKGYSVTELSHRLGKPPKFISQRLKLNDLTDEFQKALYEERITITDALKVCKLTTADQQELYKDVADDDMIEIREYELNKFTYDLTKATFDINDKELITSMGACSTCQYNTACAALFPDPDEKARCTNTGCFKSKTQLWYDRELLIAKEDPAIVLVAWDNNPSKITEELAKQGVKVYMLDEFDEVEKPEFDPINEEPNEKSTEDEREEYQDEVDNYNRELAQYEKDLQSSTHAFVVEGHGKGSYIYVKLLNKKGEIGTIAGKGLDENAVKAEQLKAEIKRLEDKEKRQVELDWFKVLPDIYKLFEDAKTHQNNTTSLTIIEQAAIIVALSRITINSMDFGRYIKCPDSARYNDISLYNWLKTKGPDQLDKWINMLLRMHLMKYIRPMDEQHPGKSANVIALMDQAKAYFPDKELEAQSHISEKAHKRSLKLNPMLTEYRDQIKELEGSKLTKVLKKGKKGIKTLTE